MDLVHRLDRALYPGVTRNWDDQLFRERILRHLEPDSVVAGPGGRAGIVKQMKFKGLVASVWGGRSGPARGG